METPHEEDGDMFQPEAVREYVAAHGYLLISSREKWIISMIQIILFLIGLMLIYKGAKGLLSFKKPK